MNVYNQDGFPSIANALLFGTTLVPLNQSTATTGFIPVIQTNGGLTLTGPSGLGITWANVLAAGNTSGANNAIMSAGQALNFADGTVKINGSVAGTNSIAIGASSSSSANNDITIGNAAITVGGNPRLSRIAIGQGSTAGSASADYSIAIGASASSTRSNSITIGRSAITIAADTTIVGGSCSASGQNDIVIGTASTTSGTGHSKICIGASANAGTGGTTYGIAIGSQSNATGAGSIAFGRFATASHTNSSAIGFNAVTTANNQIMIGNNATGGLTQVYGNVGVNGLMESAGYLVSFNQVRASIRPTVGQAVVTGSGFVVIAMPTVTYSSDYGSPAITSVASRLQTRANRCMTGFFNMIVVFNAPPVANGFFNVRIQKNTNGVVSTISVITVFVLAGVVNYSVSIPFSDYNATTPAASVFYYCDADNPPILGQDYTVQTTTHFVGQMTN